VRKKSIDFFGSTVSGSLDSSAFGGLARDRSPRPVTREGSEGAVSEPRPESDNAPSQQRVTGRVERLPETHENSNYILLRIPIEISNSAHGEKAIAIAEGPLYCSLPLSPVTISRLQDVCLIRLPRPERAKRLPIDYAALQKTYARMPVKGPFLNQTELARHLGVSRVWVSRVLKGIKRKVG